MFDLDLDNIPQNFYTRTSGSNLKNKTEEGCPISKIEDFQTSMSAFSTRIETKNNNKINTDDNFHKKKKKKKKQKKKVEFNPLITVVNIESFKKENYEGTFDPEGKCPEDVCTNTNVKKCILCTIF